MKPLLILVRILFVSIFWSILFLEGIRVIMLTNWHFDIIKPSHWNYAWNLWLSGWVIDTPKEWAFILIILAFIPLWLSGLAALCMIKWGVVFGRLTFFPLKIFNKLFEKQVHKIASKASVKVVKKKKSYKEIRPKSIRPPLEDSAYSLPADRLSALSGIPKPKSTLKPAASTQPKAPAEFNHSLFQFDDGEGDDFDFDLFDEKPKEPAPSPEVKETKTEKKNVVERSKPAPQNHRPNRGSSNSTLELLKQKGYTVLTGITIKNTLIDFIGVSSDQICLCLNDKEPGDWLADEERFNDEEPLWFSESSHRVSPVRKLNIARLILSEKISEADLSFSIDAFVIIQIGNIINAEDMFDTWKELNINVTRIDRGTPKELKLFAKALEDADAPADKTTLDKLKKIIKTIA